MILEAEDTGDAGETSGEGLHVGGELVPCDSGHEVGDEIVSIHAIPLCLLRRVLFVAAAQPRRFPSRPNLW
jgi:hypothetical protein